VALAALAWRVHDARGRDASFALLSGAAFGVVLQRSRFCFASAFRDLFVAKERRVALGLLAALAVGSVGSAVVFGAQLPDPGGGYVPPNAFISRASWHTALGGASFGLGMVLAGGCISGQLWRLGEGAAASLVALLGVVAGQLLGLLAWNSLWIAVVAEAPVVWLPKQLGYGGALLLQLAVFAALAALLLQARPSASATTTTSAEPATPAVVLRRIFREPWPAVVGGAAIGVLGTFALFRGAPLGVTAELARLARAAGDALHLLPARLEGLDLVGGCRPREGGGLSERGIFVLALVAGALVASLAAGEFRWRVARPRALALALPGGVLLGFGAFVASGCTVGALLSGVTAFSLHGWLFGGGLLAGAFSGVVALRRFAPKPAPLLDLCGESCGMPELRLAALLDGPGRPDRFTVVADDPNALEPLLAVAARRGFTGSVAPADGRGVKVEFRAGPRVP